MLDELAGAIEEAAWSRALVLALDAWRELRAPVLADLVDRLAARCPTEPAPSQRVQPWWMQRARTYDPVGATALCASASAFAHKSDVTWEAIVAAYGPFVRRLHDAAPREPKFRGVGHRNLIERLAALAAWPDDPRVARVVAGWFADAAVAWPHPHDRAAHVFYELLADELVRLRDPRVVPLLEQVLAEPRAKTVGLREHQRVLATRVIDSLAESAVRAPLLDNADAIARWAPAPTLEVTARDERELWLEAAHGDDARLVLADHLLEHGDRRGEIITLACAGGDDNARRSSALLHQYWDRWMGDLALVLDRGHCTFVGGLLDIATIGLHSTPEWAYPKVAHHRELTTISTVRPGWNASDKGYVAFLHALDRVPSRVRLTATMIEPFALVRPSWPVRTLELVTNLSDLRVPLAHVIRIAASVLPDVEALELPMPGQLRDEVLEVIPELPRQFPKLARVHVDAAHWIGDELRTALVDLATRHAFVEVDHGRFRPR